MALKYLYVPSGYKAGTAYGVLPNDSTADFDNFERNTSATRTNKDGILEAVSNNVPRIDYSDGGCPSLLIERQRINVAKTSEDLSSWGKSPSDGTVVIRTDDETSPDGNMTADVVSVSTELDGVYTLGITTVAESIYSCSAYVKHVSGSSKIKVGISSNFHSSTGTKYIVLDLSNGSIIDNEVSSFATAKVVSVGNGWYRVIIENSTVPLGGGGISNFVFYSHEDAFTEFSVWGGQIEVGDYASSYIPNSSSGTTTRSKDRSGWAANFDVMNSSEGVIQVSFKAIQTSVSNRITLGTDVNGDDHNRLTIGYSISGGVIKPFVLIAYDGEGTEVTESQVITMPSSFDIFGYNTYSFKFKLGDNELKINGEIVTLNSTMSNLNFFFGKKLKSISLNFFGNSTSNEFYGGIKHIKVFDSVTDF